jgi:hypothetical protein
MHEGFAKAGVGAAERRNNFGTGFNPWNTHARAMQVP